MAGLFLGIWKLLKWLHEEGQYTHFSLVEVVGDLIWLGMFVLPAITIGAYVGGIIDNVLQIDYGLNCAFFAGGLVVGFYLWLRSNSQ